MVEGGKTGNEEGKVGGVVVLRTEVVHHQDEGDRAVGVVEKSKDWRRETKRRRFDSLPASLRLYILVVFSIRKTMYGFPALSCLRKGWRERRDRTAGEKMLV